MIFDILIYIYLLVYRLVIFSLYLLSIYFIKYTHQIFINIIKKIDNSKN